MIRPIPGWAESSHHTADGVTVSHAPMFYLPKIWKSLDSFWLYRAIIVQLTDLRNSGRLDVIDAHFAYPDGAGCYRVAQQLDVPVVVTIRGVEEDYMRNAALARQITDTLRHADACICVSHSLRELAIQTGADTERVHVVHNAVNRHLFAPGDKAEARAVLGIDDESSLIVSVGNLLSVKRHDVLIAALAQVKRNDTHLVIIGGAMHEPECPMELLALADELGLSDRIRFVGKLDQTEVATWLRAADIFALASRREGCCNAILEALACGLPVISTPVGDNSWFIEEGVNGHLVPVGDSEAMARALSMALERQDWDRDRISADLPVGDWDRVAKETLGIFEQCVGARKNSH